MVRRGAWGYALVFLGGLVVSPVPASSLVAQLPLTCALRSTMPGRMLGLVVVVAGLGIAASAWLRLVRSVAVDCHDGSCRMTLVRRATMWWCFPLLLAPAMFSRDGWSYAAQGEMTRLGISPYVWSPSVLTGPIIEAVDPRWLDTLTPYGPVPLVWGALAAHVTGDPWLLVVAHRGLSLVGIALLAYAVPRLTAWAGRDPAHAAALVLPSPLMLAHGVAGAHNDVIMVGLMALALVIAIEHSWAVGALVGGVAAAVKLPAGLVCIGIALVSLPVVTTRRERLRRIVEVGVLAVGSLFLVGAAVGVGVGWVHALGVPGEVMTPLSLTTQLGRLVGVLLSPLEAGVSGDDAVDAARAVGAAVSLLVAARVALRAQSGVPAAGVRAATMAMVAVVLLSPVVHPWYAFWFFPLLATCRLAPHVSSALLHLSWFVGLAAPLDSSLAGAGAWIAAAVGLVGVAALIQMVSHRGGTLPPRLALPRAEHVER